jgi:hypothetical protein
MAAARSWAVFTAAGISDSATNSGAGGISVSAAGKAVSGTAALISGAGACSGWTMALSLKFRTPVSAGFGLGSMACSTGAGSGAGAGAGAFSSSEIILFMDANISSMLGSGACCISLIVLKSPPF